MDKLFYSISEVSQMLAENASTIRYWSNEFSRFINPRRNAKGNRMYRDEEIEVLKKIRYYTRDCGLSLEAVTKKLANGGSDEDKNLEIRDSLVRIKEQLLQIRESL